MNRRDFLKTFATVSIAGPSLLNAQTDQRPNIVLFMVDDMGSEVLGCYGGQSYRTPNIDKLAQTGMRFEHCYSTPVCSPSRVKIMTGRYGFRTTDRWGHLPPDEITFGDVLQSAGYTTALAGKWQMIELQNDPDHVSEHGFDEYCCWAWHEGPRYYQPRIWQNGVLLQNIEKNYGPDIYTGFITDFIKRNKDRPFLAYYPMTLTHFAKTGKRHGEPPGPDGEYQSYSEMVQKTDERVGRIVATLDELGLRENTLIVFTTDNGTPDRVTSERNGKKIQGGKGTFTDRGTRVPLIANMPGTVPTGTVNENLIDFSDFMPTFAQIAGTDVPEDRAIDGQSFWTLLQGQEGTPREWAFNYLGDRDQGWIRTKRWKLYLDSKLYDMQNDPEETTPILPEQDDKKNAAIRNRLQTTMIRLLMRQ